MSKTPSRRIPKKPTRLGCERLEDRLTPAFYSVPAASQTLSSIGIPSHTSVAPTGPTYYVAPGATGGPSTNSSAPGSAKLTLNAALPNNSTIIFADGEYRDVPNDAKWGTGLTEDGLTLQAAPGAKPWILGSKVATGWSAATNVTINGVVTPLSYASKTANSWLRTFSTSDYSSYFTPSQEIDATRPEAGNFDMVFVNGQSLRQVQDNPTTTAREGPTWFGPGTFWIGAVGTDTRVYVGENPAGKEVEVTAQGRALLSWGSDTSSDLTIRGLGFAHFAFIPVDVRASGLTVESSTFAWNGYQGLAYTETAGTGAADGVIVGNRFVGNGSAGAGGIGVDRLRFENNFAAYNNVEGFRTAWTAAGVKFGTGEDAVFKGNTIENNFASGLWLDIDMIGTKVVNNVVRSNTAGVFVELSHDTTVAFNVIRDNTSEGVRIYESSVTKVYNNTILNNNTGIKLYDSTRGHVGYDSALADTDPVFLAGSTRDTYDNEIVNNIIASTNGSATNVLLDAASTNTLAVRARRNGATVTLPRTSSTMVSKLDGNDYYDTTSPVFIKWDSTDDGSAGTASYSTLTAFRSAYPAYEVNGKAVAPLFVGTGANDWQVYTLQSGSPVIGTVLTVPADILSAAGKSQPNFIGAAGPNLAPTNFSLGNNTVAENSAPGTLVGYFWGVSDPNTANSFTYTLVYGAGDDDNSKFQIVGNSLRTQFSLDYEFKAVRSVRVRVTDQGGLSFEKVFTINLIDVPGA